MNDKKSLIRYHLTFNTYSEKSVFHTEQLDQFWSLFGQVWENLGILLELPWQGVNSVAGHDVLWSGSTNKDCVEGRREDLLCASVLCYYYLPRLQMEVVSELCLKDIGKR